MAQKNVKAVSSRFVLKHAAYFWTLQMIQYTCRIPDYDWTHIASSCNCKDRKYKQTVAPNTQVYLACWRYTCKKFKI